MKRMHNIRLKCADYAELFSLRKNNLHHPQQQQLQLSRNGTSATSRLGRGGGGGLGGGGGGGEDEEERDLVAAAPDPQRIEITMSLYSNNLSAAIMVVDGTVNLHHGRKEG